MNTNVIRLLLVGLLIMFTPSLNANEWNNSRRGVQYIQVQKQRLFTALEFGEINRRAFRTLQLDLNDIRNYRRFALRDGRLNRVERRRLQQMKFRFENRFDQALINNRGPRVRGQRGWRGQRNDFRNNRRGNRAFCR